MVVYAKPFTLATNASTSADPTLASSAAVFLPPKGHLVAIVCGLVLPSQGPCPVRIYFTQPQPTAPATGYFVKIAQGTARSDANFTGDDEVYWSGDINLDSIQPYGIWCYMRNDTGSTVNGSFTYVVVP